MLKEVGASLAVLHEVPGSLVPGVCEEAIASAIRELLSSWSYTSVEVGKERAGFMYDHSVLSLLKGPITFPNTPSSAVDTEGTDGGGRGRGGGRGGRGSGGRGRGGRGGRGGRVFTRPPALCIFKPATGPKGWAAEQHDILVVLGVHLKAVEVTPDQICLIVL